MCCRPRFLTIALLIFHGTLLLPICHAQTATNSLESHIREHYTKQEHMIPMRDGVRLYTAVYIPRDTSQKNPILIKRTPYGSGPYGSDKYPSALGPSEQFAQGRLHLCQSGCAWSVSF
jgi:predicted acyl esterase